MTTKERHVDRLVKLRAAIDTLAPEHIDVHVLSVQFNVRPSAIQNDLNIIRKVGLYPDENDTLCHLIYDENRMIDKRNRVRLVRLHTLIDATAAERADVFTLAVRLGVSIDIIRDDLKLLENLELLPVNAEAEMCELCNKPRRLITHHWTDGLGFHTKSLCMSCNAKLGQMFRGTYPTWEEQTKALDNQRIKVKI